MKHSLITGFSVIAASKSTVRRSVKLFVFLICTAGFFYQTYSFLQMYLAYPTILDISMMHPETISAPAVTICNRNRLLRQAFCKAFKDDCDWRYKTWEEFCAIYPMYCPGSKPRNFVFAIPGPNVVIDQNRTIQALSALGPQNEKDLIVRCAIKGVGKTRPCGQASAILSAAQGYPHKCFSILSLLGKPEEQPLNLTLTDEYNILLYMHPEEYMKYVDLIQAYVFVHDPRSVANAIAEGVTLKAGHSYKLYVTMQKRESLPPPYKSNCTDYMTKWKKNGGHGPITKRGCTDMCKIIAMTEVYGCVGQTITYPNNFTICSNSSIVTSDEMNEKCSASCNDACDFSLYSITTELTDDIGKQVCSPSDLHCRNNILVVKISFSRMTIQKFKHHPKFESVELFSYIGGYMGMWLGISLVSLFDFVEMIFDVLAYPVIRWRKRKKKIRQIEHMRRGTMYNMYNI